MKKYYNFTLFSLLFILLSFSLYGQGRNTSPTLVDCSNANADLIIKDVTWDASPLDLERFYRHHDTPYDSPFGDDSTPSSFHMVELDYTFYDTPTNVSFRYVFDLDIGPKSKPIVFVYGGPNFRFTPLADSNGYLARVEVWSISNGTGVASVVGVMGRYADGLGMNHDCIEIDAYITGYFDDIICGLGATRYNSCDIFENREVQNIGTVQSPDIYPNPAKDNLFVAKNGIDIQKVELLTLQGQIQHQVSIRYGVDRIQVNTSNLQSGVYLLKLDTDNGAIVEKIIVQ